MTETPNPERFTRRRWMPAAWIVWLALIAIAILLNSIRPTPGDPRWSARTQPRYPDGEGVALAWALPALGIVWTCARLLLLPSGERIGRRRLFSTWMKAGLGATVVLILLDSYVSDFNQADVGSFVALIAWFGLGLWMALILIAIVRLRAAHLAPSAGLGGAIGTAVVILIGAGLYWVDTPDDPLRRLHGAARAQALIAQLDDGSRDERDRRQQERAAGVGYHVSASRDRVDVDVAVPWETMNGHTPERIVEFWNRPGRVLLDIPPPPWVAEWRAKSGATPAMLTFVIRQDADWWTPSILRTAASEAGSIAQAPWADLRKVTHMLLDEGYLPPASLPGAAPERERVHVTLLRLIVQAERLAPACSVADVRQESNGPPLSEDLTAIAARARELRGIVTQTDAPLPTQPLASLGGQVTQLAVNRSRSRPGGCDAIDSTEEARLVGIGDALRTTAIK